MIRQSYVFSIALVATLLLVGNSRASVITSIDTIAGDQTQNVSFGFNTISWNVDISKMQSPASLQVNMAAGPARTYTVTVNVTNSSGKGLDYNDFTIDQRLWQDPPNADTIDGQVGRFSQPNFTNSSNQAVWSQSLDLTRFGYPTIVPGNGGTSTYQFRIFTDAFTGGSGTFRLSMIPNPEPSTMALLGLGLSAAGVFGWRRRKKVVASKDDIAV